MLITMKGILLWFFFCWRFICIYSAPGSDAALKSSSVELIRAVLAYPSDYCGGYGSLPTGTHYFSHTKHLIFPRYHCWYSCNGSNSKVLTVIFTIPCKQLARHLAQWHSGAKINGNYGLIVVISSYDFFISVYGSLTKEKKLRHLTETSARMMRLNTLLKEPKWDLCPSRCDMAALTAEPQWLSGIKSPQSSCIMPWRMEDSCAPSACSEPSHLTHLLDLDNEVTVTLIV